MRNRLSIAVVSLLLSGCRNPETAPLTSNPPAETPKAGLGAIRSALSIYYGDMEGQYPSNLAALTIGGKYLSALPAIGPLGLHPASNAVRNGTVPTDEGGWLYDDSPVRSPNAGSVLINCTHTDAKGSSWTAY